MAEFLRLFGCLYFLHSIGIRIDIYWESLTRTKRIKNARNRLVICLHSTGKPYRWSDRGLWLFACFYYRYYVFRCDSHEKSHHFPANSWKELQRTMIFGMPIYSKYVCSVHFIRLIKWLQQLYTHFCAKYIPFIRCLHCMMVSVSLLAQL